jgi:branched-chain amino acid transport system permease protein
MPRLNSALALQRRASKYGWIFTTLAVPGIFLLAPLLGLDLNDQRTVELIVLLALLVSGLNLCYGYAGELALGQIAVYAAGGYVAGYASINLTSDLLVGVLLGALIGPIIGLITGVPGLRLGGWSLGMVSFFLVLIIPDVVRILKSYTGGSAGLNGIKLPTLFGSTLSQREMYLFIVAIGALWFAIMRNIVVSRRGRALLVMRESPLLSSAVGVQVFRAKLVAYMVGAIPAGVAGALLAELDGFITPEYFSFSLAIAVLAATVLGGRTSVYGAVLGATILELGPLRAGSFENYTFVVYGLLLIIGGALLPRGLVGLGRSLWRRFGPAASRESSGVVEALDPLVLHGSVLTVEGVSKSFGGVLALNDVSIEARPGRVTSIIGPNGSGKTTLLNLINGFYHPDHGTVRLGDQAIHRLPSHRIARLGVARTFQTPIVSPELSVLDIASAGRDGLAPSKLLSVVMRLPGYRRVAKADAHIAGQALQRVGLAEQASEPSSSLPLGSRRMLEFARALAVSPSLILLDEVASGVDEDAIAELAVLIRGLAEAGATVILVEHNFRLVLEISDEVYVLANGALVASGPPREVAEHPDVIEKYLGTAPMAKDAE